MYSCWMLCLRGLWQTSHGDGKVLWQHQGHWKWTRVRYWQSVLVVEFYVLERRRSTWSTPKECQLRRLLCLSTVWHTHASMIRPKVNKGISYKRYRLYNVAKHVVFKAFKRQNLTILHRVQYIIPNVWYDCNLFVWSDYMAKYVRFIGRYPLFTHLTVCNKRAREVQMLRRRLTDLVYYLTVDRYEFNQFSQTYVILAFSD